MGLDWVGWSENLWVGVCYDHNNSHLPFEEWVKLGHSRLIDADLVLLVVPVLPPHVLRPDH